LKRREKKEGEERKIERGKEGSLKWNRVSFWFGRHVWHVIPICCIWCRMVCSFRQLVKCTCDTHMFRKQRFYIYRTHRYIVIVSKHKLKGTNH
jgi:hypothetical protein